MRAWLVLVPVVLITLVGIPLQWASVKLKLPTRRTIPVLYHRMVLALVGVRVTVVGAPSPARPLLIVSNHVSWLDIPVLGSRLPLCFVAKSEVAGSPTPGQPATSLLATKTAAGASRARACRAGRRGWRR